MKADVPMWLTPLGMETEVKSSCALNIQLGISISPDPRVTETSLRSPSTASQTPRPMVVTLLGMLSDARLVLLKACCPILVIVLGMLMETRREQRWKAKSGISVKLAGQFTWPAASGMYRQQPGEPVGTFGQDGQSVGGAQLLLQSRPWAAVAPLSSSSSFMRSACWAVGMLNRERQEPCKTAHMTSVRTAF